MSPKRRLGRPALVAGQRGESLTAVVTREIYDEACRIALRRGITVSAVVRAALEQLVRSEALRASGSGHFPT